MDWEDTKETLNRTKEEILKELSGQVGTPIGLNDKTFLCGYSIERGYPTTFSVPNNEKELMELYEDMQSYEHYYNRLDAESKGRDYFVLK